MFTRILSVVALVATAALAPSPAFADDAADPATTDTTLEAAPSPVPDPAPAPAPDPAPEPAPESLPPTPAGQPPAPVAVKKVAPVAVKAASAKPKDDDDDKVGPPLKVWVCKYVGTPGVDETAQTVIDVSSSTLKTFTGTFPATFTDAQGKSVAVGYSTGPDAIDEPTLADCPTTRVVDPPPGDDDGDDPPTDHLKVWVCKYVGTPGVDETAQTVIEVSSSTLKTFTGTFPATFTDAQGKSVAVGYSTGPDAIDEPTLADCPTTPIDPPPPGDDDGDDVKNLKVWVCKYVGTPGTDETAQSIINVADDTLDAFTGTFPTTFTDRQGKSVAIGYSTGPDAIDEPTLADCPTTPIDPPPPTVLDVFVCSYAGTPGLDEVATGISQVPEDDIAGLPGSFPLAFVDVASVRSVALGYSTGPDAIDEPTLADCPTTPVDPPPPAVLDLFVCAYSGPPGADETVVTILEVPEDTVDGFIGLFPFTFTEGASTSTALGYSSGPDAIDAPALADCPTSPTDVSPVGEELVDPTDVLGTGVDRGGPGRVASSAVASDALLPSTGASGSPILLALAVLMGLAGTALVRVGRRRP